MEKIVGYILLYQMANDICYEDIVTYFNRAKERLKIKEYTFFSIGELVVTPSGVPKYNKMHNYSKNIDRHLKESEKKFDEFNSITFEFSDSNIVISFNFLYKEKRVTVSYDKLTVEMSDEELSSFDSFVVDMMDNNVVINRNSIAMKLSN